jgi:NAD(P)H dehydrogenase (quinone)
VISKQPATYPPRHAVILAHPDPGSFNALVADAYCEAVRSCGQNAIVRDLYAMKFDPVLKDSERPRPEGIAFSPDVERELTTLAGTDVFVLVYPIWFGMPPAMMKGYIDRVLGAGLTARQIQDRSGLSLTRGRSLLSIFSSGAGRLWLDRQGQGGALRTMFGNYMKHAFGLKDYHELHFSEMVEGLDQEYIDQNIRQVQDLARRTCAAAAGDRR